MATFTKNAVATYSTIGSNWKVGTTKNEIVMGTRSEGTFPFTQQSTTVTSVKTPNYWKRKLTYVRWTPRKPPMRPPTKPVLRLPRKPNEPARRPFKVPKAPTPYQGRDPAAIESSRQRQIAYDVRVARLLRRRDASYKKALDRFQSKLDLYRRKVDYRKKKYKLALEKYNRRLLYYNNQQSLIRNGIPRMKRMRNSFALQNNPYSKSYVRIGPITGTMQTQTFYQDGPNGTHPLSTTPSGLCLQSNYTGAIEAFIPRNVQTSGSAKSAALSSAESRAMTKVFDKLQDQTVHLGNIIAERAKTIELLANIIKGIKHPLAVASRQNLKSISDNFLAFQFGVRPLLNDAYSAGTQLAKILSSQQSDRIMVYCTGHGSCDFEAKDTLYSAGAPYVDRITHAQYTADVRYVLEYKIVNGALNQLQGLGLVNPAEIAWEVMPWSFVVDWFLPIGNWIRSMNADAGLQFVTGVKTVVQRDRYSLIHTGTYPFRPVEAKLSRINAMGFEERFSQNRTVLTSPPAKPFPEFKSPISAYHITEALALLVQRFKR